MDGERGRQLQAAIDRQLDRRQSNKVLHGFPSPVFWLERDLPVPDIMRERREAYRTIPKRLNVYVGTPFCLPTTPERCGFCLFPSEVYQGRHQLDTFLDALQRETLLYRAWGETDEVANVYFGGGTSNLYRPGQYATLLGIIRALFPRLGAAAEVTMEGLPQLFTREKLVSMQQAGVNRISMGVQQLDDALIRLSGRKQSAAHVFQVIDWCRELGLPVSVDLIFGWPRQTAAHMLQDLERLVEADLPHITHYELNLAGRTDFARRRRQELPSPRQNLELYREARDFLLSRGYRQVTAYDWEKPDGPLSPAYRYEANWRAPYGWGEQGRLAGFDAFGLGFAGLSFFLGTPEAPGWAVMNAMRVEEYYRRIEAGRFPAERGYHYAPADLRVTTLFQMLHGMEADRALYRALFEVDPVEEHAPVWEVLVERGWAEIAPGAVRLVGDGVFYTPLVQNLLGQARMEEMRKKGDVGAAGESLVEVGV